jgi:hypothetical protein
MRQGSRSAFIGPVRAGNHARWDPKEGREVSRRENDCQATWEGTWTPQTCQEPFCPLAGRCQGKALNEPAAACARSARLAVCGTHWLLRLLRHHGERSTATGFLPSGRVDLAQMAGTSNAGNAVHLGQLPSAPRPPSTASCQDYTTATPDGTNLSREEPDVLVTKRFPYHHHLA